MAVDLNRGPFDVSEADLMRLNAHEAVQLFHDLLVAEAIGSSTPVTALVCPRPEQ